MPAAQQLLSQDKAKPVILLSPTAEPMDDRKFLKSLEKMKALSACQESFSKIVLSNVHRRSKSIKKLER